MVEVVKYIVESKPIAYVVLALWFGFWTWAFYHTLEFMFG
jgi:hypothetical protein